MKRFCAALLAAGLGFSIGVAHAEDSCQTLLVGSTFTCSFEFESSPGSTVSFPLSFAAVSSPDVLTEFQASLSGLPFACGCLPKGKPGKLVPSDKSIEFGCVEAETGFTNNETISGKVAGGGSKIVKARYFGNTQSNSGAVFSCTKD